MGIVEIKTEKEIAKIFSLVKSLRPHLSYSQFKKLQKQIPGYTLLGVVQDKKYVAFAGIAIMTNLYFGKHVWIFEMFTLNKHRSKGIGAKLMEHIVEYGKRNACESIALSSRLDRTRAHAFYNQKMGFEKASYVFKKDL